MYVCMYLLALTHSKINVQVKNDSHYLKMKFFSQKYN